MSYIALARQWRPRTFSQLLGQDPVKKTLINSLDQNRVHHAYLFTGTRGVGKTTVARLFAKSLSCERGISSSPCLTCSNCLSIDQGCFIDLIEVDGASRTRVEDTRELLENIQYVPSSGRFKVYLIDEVHMLSQHSFNALLKTLEEPPEHVKFLLATTDPQKLPITVLSRCIQFNLKHISVETIEEQLRIIVDAEQLTYEPDALKLIARAAHGSMRDALSILDQAIAGCDRQLLTSPIKQLLGYSQQDYALQLLLALSELDVHRLLTISQQIADEGGPFKYVLDELISYIHRVSIRQLLPDSHTTVYDDDNIHTLATRFTPEDTQLFYHILLKSQDELNLAPASVIAFEMILLRLYTFKPAAIPDRPMLAFEAASNTPTPTADTPVTDNAEPIATNSIKPVDDAPSISWNTILPELQLSGLALNAAENATFLSKDNQTVTLQVETGHQSVFTPTVVKRLESSLSEYYQETIKLTLVTTDSKLSTPAARKQSNRVHQQQQAENAIHQDPFFQQLQTEFSAELVKNSITLQKSVL